MNKKYKRRALYTLPHEIILNNIILHKIALYVKNVKIVKLFFNLDNYRKLINFSNYHYDSLYYIYGSRDWYKSITLLRPCQSICRLNLIDSSYLDELLIYVIMEGNLEIVKWLFHYYNGTPAETFSEGMDYAAAHGHLEIIKFFHENNVNCSTDAMDFAADKGHLEILKWLYQNRGEGCTKDAMNDAVCNSNFKIVKWLSQSFESTRFSPNRKEGCSNYALRQHIIYINYQGTNMIKIIHKNVPECDFNAMNNAASCGKLDIVKFLYYNCKLYNKNPNIHCNINLTNYMNKALDIAIKMGHLPIIKFLYQLNFPCSNYPIDSAVNSGNLKVIKWLHNNFRLKDQTCSINAMNTAARNGFLEIIKWLHQNRNEGCSSIAMDHAAHNGHLEVIKWLHENRTEGCTIYAMTYAAVNRDLPMVKWFYQNRNEGFDSNYESLKNMDDPDILFWLGCSSLKKNKYRISFQKLSFDMVSLKKIFKLIISKIIDLICLVILCFCCFLMKTIIFFDNYILKNKFVKQSHKKFKYFIQSLYDRISKYIRL